MFFGCVAFGSAALLQNEINKTQASGALELNDLSGTYECPLDREKAKECVHGAWQIVSYFIITVAEVLFSISGLHHISYE